MKKRTCNDSAEIHEACQTHPEHGFLMLQVLWIDHLRDARESLLYIPMVVDSPHSGTAGRQQLKSCCASTQRLINSLTGTAFGSLCLLWSTALLFCEWLKDLSQVSSTLFPPVPINLRGCSCKGSKPSFALSCELCKTTMSLLSYDMHLACWAARNEKCMAWKICNHDWEKFAATNGITVSFLHAAEKM